MLPAEFIAALCTVFGMFILMFFAFRKVPSSPALQKVETTKPRKSSTTKKKKTSKAKGEKKENEEVEAILKKELARTVGISVDAPTTQPETIGEAGGVKKRSTAQPKSIANPPPSAPKKQQNSEGSVSLPSHSASAADDGFKPVAASSRLPKKKEKPRTNSKEFEIDEEMERKLAAFFSRSDRRNKTGVSLSSSGVPVESEPRGSYALVKEEFSIDSKW